MIAEQEALNVLYLKYGKKKTKVDWRCKQTFCGRGCKNAKHRKDTQHCKSLGKSKLKSQCNAITHTLQQSHVEQCHS